MSAKKLLVIGLDCLEPSLVFDRWRDQLPHLSSFFSEAYCARMRSCDPPITVPAWSCMFSGKTPGELGVYGFRNRSGFGYEDKTVADARFIKEPRLWEIASRSGRRNIVIGVPQTYPAKALNGYMVSGILASSEQGPTFPGNLSARIKAIAPSYEFDVSGFRHLDKKQLLQRIYRMSDARFRLARHMMQNYPWELFVLVEIGPDRLQHGFWQFLAQESPFYDPRSPYKNAVLNYYRYLDEEVGRLIALGGSDCDIAIVSDHGAQTMKKLFRINQWLVEKGWLFLRRDVPRDAPFAERVDWSRTKAWADGGYYARIYLNIRDREPKGILPAEQAPVFIAEIKKALTALDIPTEAFTPQERYPVVRDVAPDLFVYFDELAIRASASFGASLFTTENDTGPDGANHSFYGVFAQRGAAIKPGFHDEVSIYDLLPTWLNRMGLNGAQNLSGSILF